MENSKILSNRIQIHLANRDRTLLDSITKSTGLSTSDVMRGALVLATEVVTDSPNRLQVVASPIWPFPDWWLPLCKRLLELKENHGYVTTASGVRNRILAIDEVNGKIEMRSENTRSGGSRTLTLSMLQNRDGTTHGAVVRALRDLADSLTHPPSTSGWVGPFQVSRLLSDCLNSKQPWPPNDHGVYLVSRGSWKVAPTSQCSPLYAGSTTGRSPRFCTRVGDLIADMHGLFGDKTGHSSGGQKLYKWCEKHRTTPGKLFIGWLVDPVWCGCIEREVIELLRPELNERTPPHCPKHPRGRPARSSPTGKRTIKKPAA